MNDPLAGAFTPNWNPYCCVFVAWYASVAAWMPTSAVPSRPPSGVAWAASGGGARFTSRLPELAVPVPSEPLVRVIVAPTWKSVPPVRVTVSVTVGPPSGVAAVQGPHGRHQREYFTPAPEAGKSGSKLFKATDNLHRRGPSDTPWFAALAHAFAERDVLSNRDMSIDENLFGNARA